jgi:hypothetical protein
VLSQSDGAWVARFDGNREQERRHLLTELTRLASPGLSDSVLARIELGEKCEEFFNELVKHRCTRRPDHRGKRMQSFFEVSKSDKPTASNARMDARFGST